MGRVVRDLADAGGGDEARDAVALARGVEVELGGLRAEALGDDQFELAGLVVDQADGEVIEVEQLVGRLDDPVLEPAQTLHGVLRADELGVDRDQVSPGLLDGGHLAIEAAGFGHVADDGHQPLVGDARALALGQRDDDLVPALGVLVADLDVAGGAAAAAVALIDQPRKAVAGGRADAFADRGVERAEERVGPDDRAVGPEKANALVDGVKEGVGTIHLAEFGKRLAGMDDYDAGAAITKLVGFGVGLAGRAIHNPGGLTVVVGKFGSFGLRTADNQDGVRRITHCHPAPGRSRPQL